MRRTADLEPLNGQIVVRRLQNADESTGLHGVKIALPQGVQEESQKATVLYVWHPYTDADGVYHESKVQPDDVVFMPRYCGQQFQLDNGEKIVFLAEDKLLGVIREVMIREHYEGNGVRESAEESVA